MESEGQIDFSASHETGLHRYRTAAGLHMRRAKDARRKAISLGYLFFSSPRLKTLLGILLSLTTPQCTFAQVYGSIEG